MKWLRIVVGGLVGLIALLALLGLVLSREHWAASRIQLSQTPETVWPVVRDIEGTKAWWPEIKDVKRVESPEGKEIWEETLSDGTIGIEVVASEPPDILRTLIVLPKDAPFGGTWTYVVRAADGGTGVTIFEHGWVSNPIFRSISRLMGHHGTMDSYLTALSRKFGESGKPEHLVIPDE